MDKAFFFFSLILRRVHCHGMRLNRFYSVKSTGRSPFLKRWVEVWAGSLRTQEFTCFAPVSRLLLLFGLLSFDIQIKWEQEIQAKVSLSSCASVGSLRGVDASDTVLILYQKNTYLHIKSKGSQNKY